VNIQPAARLHGAADGVDVGFGHKDSIANFKL
jgi:hypothetical protein